MQIEMLRTIMQHYLFIFGMIRNAQIVQILIRTKYLNSLVVKGMESRFVSGSFLFFSVSELDLLLLLLDYLNGI